ncbi:hypothetical protein C1I98_28545 [Spongiactinospora gelatinilytica]|uniref:Uncharacterized protein n=1 Tax=Spongiactinospora gelatinilytica TaxID=2666298 RepID=A0A2W2G8J9_9ACTN|nr:hypothetical protein [Spongiactinospora gelatinilytica]PZG33710.1 hypothetical protein C1I98_28545 [Spongiactinospora gelatinilytica]
MNTSATVTPFEAGDVPALRRDLLEWLRDGRGLHYHTLTSQHAGTMLGLPEYDGHPDLMASFAEILCDREARSLAVAELYFVTAEMTEIVQAAAVGLPAFVPDREDFPSPAGLIVFETPLVQYDRLEEPAAVIVENRLAADFRKQPFETVGITAATWGPYDGAGQWQSGGVLMSFYRDRREMLANLLDDRIRGDVRGTLARLMPDNEFAFQFTAGPERAAREADLRRHDSPAFTSYWAKHLMATLLLMRQPLVYQRAETIRRNLRRQLQRAGYPTGDVRVLDARPRRYERVASDGTEAAAGERKLGVRFPVAGHWRNHWYPRRQVHRPLWIDEHWRGPEDAPIVHQERVRVLRAHSDAKH